MQRLVFAACTVMTLISCGFSGSAEHGQGALTAATRRPDQVKSYLVEPMVCVGLIKSKPAGMHPDYEGILMKFQSFKSKRRDGRWVDSLEVQNRYFQRDADIPDSEGPFGESWYMGPLYSDGKVVTRESLSGRGDNLNLRLVGKDKVGGRTVHKLKGTYGVKGSVVGSYTYELTCEASPTKEPSRQVDLTASGRD
ncbi:MAG: hypothetical protein RIQ81_897 [Pseudomonadota bacterium]|jgi:hypothetical protein